MSGTVIPSTKLLFDDADVGGFIEHALDEHPIVPISEGTVQIRRFESPLLKPVPATASPARKTSRPIAEAPPWLLQITSVVPARHEKAVVAGILFFFLFGVLSFAAGLTMLLFFAR